MKMNRNSVFQIPPHVLAREVGDETVILDLEKGTYLGLDSVGARMWSLMGEGKSVDGICETMIQEYEVSAEVLEKDILSFAEELAEQDLVRVKR